MAERSVSPAGIELHVTIEGEGPPVLLLHGFPDSALLWEHQIRALADAGHRVIAPDLRGMGRSERPEGVENYAFNLMVQDLTGLLDELGEERAMVAGHDFGSALAWYLAMVAPDRVERLAALSVGHFATRALAGLEQARLSWYMLWFQTPGVAEAVLPEHDWRFYREWAWGGAPADGNPTLRRQIDDMSRPGALTAGLNWYRANIRPETYVMAPEQVAGFPRIPHPVLGVWSDGDIALGEAQMALSERFVDGPWRFEKLKGVGHWIPAEAPERLSELLVDFFAK